ncbi:MAG TPA: aminoacyl-tRNA hydrolase [Holophaga sp.]|nr:aminoacyl-tRNA hydrolase [Holophaga sp.]
MSGWLARQARRLVNPNEAPVSIGQARAWTLVPLGNPGSEYAETRHNLGRLLLQRWVDSHCPNPGGIHTFPSGTLYSLKEPFLALVPATYMNLSGQVCREAVNADFAPARLILLHDDKDLPLGMGRFRLSGSDGGHNGLRSTFDALDTSEVPRLRLGIGPFVRPLDQFVLGTWTDEEWSRIEALDVPFARFMEALASVDELGELPGRVNGEAFWLAEKSIEPQG